jgi:hypothetical protein
VSGNLFAALEWVIQHGGKIALDDDGGAVIDGVKGHIPDDVFQTLEERKADLAHFLDGRPDAATSGWMPRLTMLSDVQPERVGWLWHGRIALGKINLLDGDPGLGKSTITDDLAARVSTGAPMPDGTRSDLDGPAGVVILSAEDGMGDTIRPRLDAAGADTSRIAAIEAMEHAGKERGVTLADLDAIETAIERVGAKLVVIDPLMAYLGSETNSYRDQDVRGVLAPLARLAERHGVAIVLIRHLSKGAQSNVLYRGGGSIGIIGAVRVALMVGHDPDDPEGPRRILAVAKSNLAAFPPALAYHIEQMDNGASRIVWEGATHHTAAAITATMQQGDGERSALDEAMDVLRTILADGRVPADEVKQQARRAGVSDRTLDRAKTALDVRAKREGFGRAGVWYWTLDNLAPESSNPHRTPDMSIGRHQKSMAFYGDLGALWSERDYLKRWAESVNGDRWGDATGFPKEIGDAAVKVGIPLDATATEGANAKVILDALAEMVGTA